MNLPTSSRGESQSFVATVMLGYLLNGRNGNKWVLYVGTQFYKPTIKSVR